MSGFRTTIYLPKALGKALQRMDINVSEVCQQALWDEIDKRIKSLQADVDAGERARSVLERVMLPKLHDLENGSGEMADLDPMEIEVA